MSLALNSKLVRDAYRCTMLMVMSGIRRAELAGEEAFGEQHEEGSQPSFELQLPRASRLLSSASHLALQTGRDDFCRGTRLQR